MTIIKKKIKRLDVGEEEVNVVVENKKALTRDILFKEEEKVVEANKYEISFLIFHLIDFEKRHRISQDKLIILLYLRELSLFSIQIKVLNRTIRLGEFLSMKLIEEDYSKRGVKLYKLSLSGILLVDEFNTITRDNSKYLLDNRHTDIDAESSIKASISSYFS